VVAQVASLARSETVTVGRPLLLYLADSASPTRLAIAPALAAAAGHAGWAFDCYYDALRAGRHFGGPTPEEVPAGRASGSPFAGGAHEAKLLWLATRFRVTAVGDAASSLLPVLEGAGADLRAGSPQPGAVYKAAFDALGADIPSRLIVVDGRPQGANRLVVAPYLYPAFFAADPALGVDVSAEEEQVSQLEALGIQSIEALFVDEARAATFPRRLDGEVVSSDATYESLTAALAERWANWGAGVLLGDPELVAAQLPKAARLRLLPLYGRPQVRVLRRAERTIRTAREPVYGRQYDDRDFFELARLGHGLQVLDPSPPFDATAVEPVPLPSLVPMEDVEPDDRLLEQWADEGRVLLTLLFWGGMIRELDCYGPLFDLVAETGLRGGLVLTAESLEHAGGTPISLLAVPRARGGVLGLVEPLLGSTGRGVAAEASLPDGVLAATLTEAREASARVLPAELVPRGWWPLLDAPLVPHRARTLELRDGRPVVVVPPRGREQRGASNVLSPDHRDLRDLAGRVARRLHLAGLFAERRPYGLARPAASNDRVAAEVRSAGFTYMWTKTSFGRCTPRLLGDDFVTLPFTAGSWDGWSPFYTVARASQLRSAERRLRRDGGPGWLATTVDLPLWLLPGELREHGHQVHELAVFAANGGSSGELVNVTPNVVARYARLLVRRSVGTASTREG
jgi:hypothetical protein